MIFALSVIVCANVALLLHVLAQHKLIKTLRNGQSEWRAAAYREKKRSERLEEY